MGETPIRKSINSGVPASFAPGYPLRAGNRISLKRRRVASCCSLKKFALVCATASGTIDAIDSGFTSIRPRIHGTGPGAVGAAGGTAGGTEGATGVAVCCPNIVLADADAATIALTKSRRRIVVVASSEEVPLNLPYSIPNRLWVRFK